MAGSYRMPHRVVQSISPTIGISCSPGPCKLRHRGDVEHGLIPAPILLMTSFARLGDADAAGGR